MPEELGAILDNLDEKEVINYGDLVLTSGIWQGLNHKKIYITTAWSGWGKVSASRAATRLISASYKDRKVDIVMFTGVAGAANNQIKQWDIIVANSVIQHDMDARPLYEKFHVDFNKELLKPQEKLLNKFSNLYQLIKKR